MQSELRQKLQFTITNLSCWTFAALVSTTSFYLEDLENNPDIVWVDAFSYHLTVWLFWGFLTVYVFRISRKYLYQQVALVKTFAIHGLLSLAWMPVYVLLSTYAALYFNGYKITDFQPVFASVTRPVLLLEYFYFWGIAAVSYVIYFYKRAQDERQRNEILARQVAQAELRTLKSQLHPHFLFNSLNSISSLVRSGEREVALSVLSALSELLRYALESENTPWVTLVQEMDATRKYLDIQKVRFSDRLTVQIDVAANCKNYIVPCMLILPLVENAVSHGLRGTQGNNHISVYAMQESEKLVIHVTNSLYNDTERRQDSRGFGIGHKNVRARLWELYGNKHEFNFSSENKRAEVCLRLPL